MSENLMLYESVAHESMAMLEAARRADWDAMLAAEKRCARMIARLKAAGGEAPLDPRERRRKKEIILSVLAHDAEIRRLVDPRLRALEGMLTACAQRRRLERAYRL